MGSLLHDLLVGTLERGGEVTLQRQLYQAIQAAILQGRLPVDHKLPSTRALAQQLLVSRLTVSLAYERLLDEGYLYARAGSGTFVADTLPQVSVEVLPGEGVGQAPLSARGKAITARFGALARVAGAFVPGVADADLFPFHVWKRLHNRYLSKRHADLGGYVDQGGYRPLREALSAYLYAARAVRCSPAQVIITMGTHQSLDLVARLLADVGDTVWLESPCHWGAPVVFAAAGLHCAALQIDTQGACLPTPEPHATPRLAFVTPSHQYPTGNIMTLQRRRDWLAFAEAQNLWMVEDDYDSEFRYDIEPLPSLQGLGRQDRVIYLGTFSKVTYPGLRLSYLVVPEALADAFGKGLTQLYRPGFLAVQAAMADFIQEGHFARHIRKMRAEYAERRSYLQHCLDVCFGELISYSSGQAGLHLAVRIGAPGTARKMLAQAEGFGLVLRGGYSVDPQADDQNLMVLGYGGVKVTQIEAAVQQLRALYDRVA
ncbi:PLP-dependent aminotransferase family protein [Pseudomonas brassicae]|nr:PLP-dependent aminotransferase family protein [Pseudomonas brassicae]